MMKAILTTIRNYVHQLLHSQKTTTTTSTEQGASSTADAAAIIHDDASSLSGGTSRSARAAAASSAVVVVDLQEERLVRKAAAWIWYMRGNNSMMMMMAGTCPKVKAAESATTIKWSTATDKQRIRRAGVSRFQVEACRRMTAAAAATGAHHWKGVVHMEQPADVEYRIPRTTTSTTSYRRGAALDLAFEDFPGSSSGGAELELECNTPRHVSLSHHDRLTCTLSSAPSICSSQAAPAGLRRSLSSRRVPSISNSSNFSNHQRRTPTIIANNISNPPAVVCNWRRPLGSHDYELSPAGRYMQLPVFQRRFDRRDDDDVDAIDWLECINSATPQESSTAADLSYNDCRIDDNNNNNNNKWSSTVVEEAGSSTNKGGSNPPTPGITLLQALISDSSSSSYMDDEQARGRFQCGGGIELVQQVSAARLKGEHCYSEFDQMVDACAEAPEETNYNYRNRCAAPTARQSGGVSIWALQRRHFVRGLKRFSIANHSSHKHATAILYLRTGAA